MDTNKEQRQLVRELSDNELDDELLRPTGNWKEDINRETLRRILDKLRLRQMEEQMKKTKQYKKIVTYGKVDNDCYKCSLGSLLGAIVLGGFILLGINKPIEPTSFRLFIVCMIIPIVTLLPVIIDKVCKRKVRFELDII